MDESRGIGAPRRRDREDPALLRGAADYTDDFQPADAVHAAFLRSPYGHACIERVDVSPAQEHPGVLAAFTAAELAAADAPTTVRASTPLPDREYVDRPLLVAEVARYPGDPVALVIATDRYVARDALEAVRVEYERLPAVTNPDAALEAEFTSLSDPESARVGWAGGPASVEWTVGDESAVDQAFDDADRVVALPVHNQRVAPVPLEPRSVLATYDADTESFTIRAATQTPHADRDRIAETLSVPPETVRVVAPAVGGGFGTKGAKPYPEPPLVAWCARHLDRPVKWTATRTEALRTDHHGRDVHARGELALDADGTFRGLRVRGRVGIGAYPFRGPSSCLKPQLLSGAYEIPAIHARVTGVLTNATPLGSYRGAGRPESIYVIERLIARAATELGMDPADLRRRNFVPPAAFPYETPTGAVYDSGDYEAALDRALELADYESLREAAGDDDRYRGVGIASFVENTGSSSPGHARVTVDADGTVTAACGTTDHGQGHGTTFAQVLAEEFELPDTAVEVREGDTADLETGVGTFGSRSAPVGAGVLSECARELIDRGRRIAAERLEAAPADVEYAAGEFHVRGARERSVSLGEVAVLARDDEGEGLTATGEYRPEGRIYAFGTHVAAVAVDPATGEIEIERYVAVDDCGPRINPRLVEGQVHGGIAQGLGQALYETAAYDDTGSLVTGSLQDYALPRAADVPELETGATVTPSPWTIHGVKGVGEAGTIAAPPAVVNAVVDALEPHDVETLKMPLHSQRVWKAIQETD